MASLASHNTFGVDCHTQELIEVTDLQQLQMVSKNHDRESIFVLGGGSNILFVDEAPATILHMANQGIRYDEDGEAVLVTAMSGVVWHDLVQDSLAKGFSGLENLALIPGLCGAAPIQNIGAYGVELEQRFVSLTAINLRTAEIKIFGHSDCQFAYRDSYFKSPEGRDWCIWDITLRLDQQFTPVLGHQGLSHLAGQSENLKATDVFSEVVRIRQTKLPDPADLGNAGSFFKNPVISQPQYDQLLTDYPDIVAYHVSDSEWKIPAAWLIDRAGLKGYREGAVGTHTKQALVMVNHGGATGKELVKLAKFIQAAVQQKFAIMLEPEVNIVSYNGLTTLEELAC